MKTRTIEGHEITLEAGVRYVATRPMGTGSPVSIRTEAELFAGPTATITIQGLTLDAADRFLAAFNDGRVSFAGRIWS